MARPLLQAHGDDAIQVTFGDRIDEGVNRRVQTVAAAVRAARRAGGPWLAPIPAYASLLVGYDPLRLDFEAAMAALGELLAATRADRTQRAHEPPLEVPVRYGGEDGPDLAAVADQAGLAQAEVVELHCSVVYRAYMLGFAPGFAYLGELPVELELPRRATPRLRVPAGSVAIAGRQTAVYPSSTPGGWHLIGRTELSLWDAQRDAPALITAGRRVRFVARA